MKNDCGHPTSSEDSVLLCYDCEADRRRREDDALWNAALEAALAEATEVTAKRGYRFTGDERKRILALKRTT